MKDILLSEVFDLYEYGLIIGGLISFIPFIIGYVVQASLDFFTM